MIDVWYVNKEIDAIISELIKRLNDTDYYKKLVKIFYDQWELIMPVLSGEKKLRTMEEFKEYFDNLNKWWSAMAVITVAPISGGLNKKIEDQFMKMRKETESYTEKQDDIFIDFIAEALPELKDLTFIITPDEIFNYKNLSTEDIANIKKRANGYFLANNKVSLIGELENYLQEHDLEFENIKIDEQIEEIKGQTASLGKIKGKVRKILLKDELANLQAGEVLVTVMTSPEFVPAMKKAAAIITDEGGVTCHAAIVSRELKKPCIIGTKIATQVLKDGMEVEVDADNGVVKILK